MLPLDSGDAAYDGVTHPGCVCSPFVLAASWAEQAESSGAGTCVGTQINGVGTEVAFEWGGPSEPDSGEGSSTDEARGIGISESSQSSDGDADPGLPLSALSTVFAASRVVRQVPLAMRRWRQQTSYERARAMQARRIAKVAGEQLWRDSRSELEAAAALARALAIRIKQWHEMTTLRQARVRHASSVSMAMRRRILLRGLSKLIVFCSQCVELHEICARADAHWRSVRLQRHVVLWAGFSFWHKRSASSYRRALSWWASWLILRALSRWRRECVTLGGMSSTLQSAGDRHHHYARRQALGVWQGTILQRHIAHSLRCKATRHTLVLLMRSWRLRTVSACGISNAARMCVGHQTRFPFQRWRSQAAVEFQHKRLQCTALRRCKRLLTLTALDRWRAESSKGAELVVSPGATALNYRMVLKRTGVLMARWRAHTEAVRAMAHIAKRKNLLDALRRWGTTRKLTVLMRQDESLAVSGAERIFARQQRVGEVNLIGDGEWAAARRAMVGGPPFLPRSMAEEDIVVSRASRHRRRRHSLSNLPAPPRRSRSSTRPALLVHANNTCDIEEHSPSLRHAAIKPSPMAVRQPTCMQGSCTMTSPKEERPVIDVLIAASSAGRLRPPQSVEQPNHSNDALSTISAKKLLQRHMYCWASFARRSCLYHALHYSLSLRASLRRLAFAFAHLHVTCGALRVARCWHPLRRLHRRVAASRRLHLREEQGADAAARLASRHAVEKWHSALPRLLRWGRLRRLGSLKGRHRALRRLVKAWADSVATARSRRMCTALARTTAIERQLRTGFEVLRTAASSFARHTTAAAFSTSLALGGAFETWSSWRSRALVRCEARERILAARLRYVRNRLWIIWSLWRRKLPALQARRREYTLARWSYRSRVLRHALAHWLHAAWRGQWRTKGLVSAAMSLIAIRFWSRDALIAWRSMWRKKLVSSHHCTLVERSLWRQFFACWRTRARHQLVCRVRDTLAQGMRRRRSAARVFLAIQASVRDKARAERLRAAEAASMETIARRGGCVNRIREAWLAWICFAAHLRFLATSLRLARRKGSLRAMDAWGIFAARKRFVRAMHARAADHAVRAAAATAFDSLAAVFDRLRYTHILARIILSARRALISFTRRERLKCFWGAWVDEVNILRRNRDRAMLRRASRDRGTLLRRWRTRSSQEAERERKAVAMLCASLLANVRSRLASLRTCQAAKQKSTSQARGGQMQNVVRTPLGYPTAMSISSTYSRCRRPLCNVQLPCPACASELAMSASYRSLSLSTHGDSAIHDAARVSSGASLAHIEGVQGVLYEHPRSTTVSTRDDEVLLDLYRNWMLALVGVARLRMAQHNSCVREGQDYQQLAGSSRARSCSRLVQLHSEFALFEALRREAGRRRPVALDVMVGMARCRCALRYWARKSRLCRCVSRFLSAASVNDHAKAKGHRPLGLPMQVVQRDSYRLQQRHADGLADDGRRPDAGVSLVRSRSAASRIERAVHLEQSSPRMGSRYLAYSLSHND